VWEGHLDLRDPPDPQPGIRTDLSPVFRTPAELAYGGPILLDMVSQVMIILYDRGGVLSRYLSQLEETLRSTGARRIPWSIGIAGRPSS